MPNTNNFSSISDILSNSSSLPSIPQHNSDETTKEEEHTNYIDSTIDTSISTYTTESQTTEIETKKGAVSLSPQVADAIRSSLRTMQEQLDSLYQLLDGGLPIRRATASTHLHPVGHLQPESTGNVIEGVFDGQSMVGADGKTYPVPPNYASKSKLVEGDLMKLTITGQGSFIFKQIAPTARKQLIGEVIFDPGLNQWSVAVGTRLYKILTASATFYKLKPGSECTLLVSEDGDCSWGAVDNAIGR